MAVGGAVGDVRIYNAETGDAVAKCGGHPGGIYTLQFYPDSQRLVTAGFDGTVRIYDMSGKLEKEFVPVPIERRGVAEMNAESKQSVGGVFLPPARCWRRRRSAIFSPRGAQRGKSFTLYLRGEGLTPRRADREHAAGDFLAAHVIQRSAVGDGRGAARLRAARFWWRSRRTRRSGSIRFASSPPTGSRTCCCSAVSDLPEIEETESTDPKQSNDRPAKAQRIAVPVLVNGTLVGPDIDNYTFQPPRPARSWSSKWRRGGQAPPSIRRSRFSMRPGTRSRGTTMRRRWASIRASKSLFAKAGEYRVQMHDSKFSDQAQNFYRLKIAQLSLRRSMFPLGGRAAGTEVTLSGGNLAQPVKVTVDLDTKSGYALVRLPGSMSRRLSSP